MGARAGADRRVPVAHASEAVLEDKNQKGKEMRHQILHHLFGPLHLRVERQVSAEIRALFP